MLIYVKGKELSDAFNMVSVLNAETVCFTTRNNKLIVTANKTSQFLTTIDIVSSTNYIDTTMNVLFYNVSSLIQNKENVGLEFTPVAVTLATKTVSLPLPVSDEIVPDIVVPDVEPFEIINKDDLRFSLYMFRATSLFQKVLQSEKPLQLCGNYAVMQFPTVWFRKRSSSIESVVTKEQATAMLKFEPDSYYQDDKLYLYKDNSVLVLTVSPIPIEDEFLGLIDRTVSVGKKYIKDFSKHIQDLSKVVGVAECSIYITKDNLYVSVTKGNLHIKDTINEEVILSFDTRLEYMDAVLKLFNEVDSIEILKGDGVVAFRDRVTAVILSVGGVSSV